MLCLRAYKQTEREYPTTHLARIYIPPSHCPLALTSFSPHKKIRGKYNTPSTIILFSGQFKFKAKKRDKEMGEKWFRHALPASFYKDFSFLICTWLHAFEIGTNKFLPYKNSRRGRYASFNVSLKYFSLHSE